MELLLYVMSNDNSEKDLDENLVSTLKEGDTFEFEYDGGVFWAHILGLSRYPTRYEWYRAQCICVVSALTHKEGGTYESVYGKGIEEGWLNKKGIPVKKFRCVWAAFQNRDEVC